MRTQALALLFMLCFSQMASSAIVFRMARNGSGPIGLGETATFSLFARSDSGAISNLAGIDFAINAADPGKTGNRLVGGRFTQGTSNFFPAAAGGFQIPFPSSLALFGANSGAGLSLGTTDTLLATLTLGTAGIPGSNTATPGTYALGLTDVLAVDQGFNTIATSIATPTLNYEIVSAVPEPSSMLLLGLAAIGLRWRRKSFNRLGVAQRSER